MAYSDKYGVRFSDDRKVLFHCPSSFNGDYTIPKDVRKISERAFVDCSGLTSVKIPDSVMEIGKGAFGFCTGLTSVTIGKSVTNIGEGAFYKCSGLKSVTIEAETPPTLETAPFPNGCSIYVPCNALSVYIKMWDDYPAVLCGIAHLLPLPM